MKTRFLGVALLALTIILALGGCIGTGNVTGLIQNQTEYYVAGANIAVKGTSISTQSEPLTGRFALMGVPSGKQTLVVTKWGFDTREYPINVPIGQTEDVTIQQNISIQSTTESSPKFIIYNSTGQTLTYAGQPYAAGSSIVLNITPGEHDIELVMDHQTYLAHLIAYMNMGEAYAIAEGGEVFLQIREQFGGNAE